MDGEVLAGHLEPRALQFVREWAKLRQVERAAAMRREILKMDLGQPDGVNVADELARDRSGERW